MNLSRGQYVVDNTGLSAGDSLVDPESLVVLKMVSR